MRIGYIAEDTKDIDLTLIINKYKNNLDCKNKENDFISKTDSIGFIVNNVNEIETEKDAKYCIIFNKDKLDKIIEIGKDINIYFGNKNNL